VRALLGPGAADTEVDDDVLRGCVEVLRRWGWDRRPAAVVAMPSRTRPLLVGSLARRLAEVGRLPLSSLAYAHGGPPEGSGGGNSAFRPAAVWDRVVVPPEVAAGLAALDEAPVLLVDDLADSRWTLTVAARALRRAGAGGVLPFVLGLAG